MYGVCGELMLWVHRHNKDLCDGLRDSCIRYAWIIQQKCKRNTVWIQCLCWRDAPEIGLYEFVFLCKGKLVVVLGLDIILFYCLFEFFALYLCLWLHYSPDCLFSSFSNLLSNRSLIYLRACVRGKTLSLLNCDCFKSSGRENNSITLKHWELSQRPVICFRAPDFSCRYLNWWDSTSFEVMSHVSKSGKLYAFSISTHQAVY